MREIAVYKNINTEFFKEKLLYWSQNFSHVAFYDSNNYSDVTKDFTYQNYDCIIAIDSISELKIGINDNFNLLEDYYINVNDWIFGFLTYDLKNEIEDLESNNDDGLKFPIINFFQPKLIFFINDKKIKVEFNPDYTPRVFINTIIRQIKTFNFSFLGKDKIDIKEKVTKKEYLENIKKIQKHINKGDIYEMNYCIEFFSENCLINPVEKYLNLRKISPAPFSCFYKYNDKFLLSASPERFLMKRENEIISQPIKGTARRGTTKEEDKLIKEKLENCNKEKSENVMIVDLVRNDLSKTAEEGSVEVEELFGIYSFPQVHQMISTIKSILQKNVSFFKTIKDCFPMGSMTGAPKIKAMQIIEEIENTKRGLYSGAVGYISPYCSFDFNVVIRSILYNKSQRYLSFMVGSAITSLSEPEKEYEECLLKAEGLKKVLLDNL